MIPSVHEAQLRRIAFVTRRFADLQGLKSVALGAAFLVGAICWHLLPPDFRDVRQQLFMPAILIFLMSAPIEDYYARIFGRVPPLSPRGHRPGDLSVKPDTIGPMVVQFGMMTDMMRSYVYPGGASAAAGCFAGYSLWVLVRDGAGRSYYVIGLVVGIVGVVMSWSPVGPDVAFRMDPAIAARWVSLYSLIGVALIAVGLLDHRLLSDAIFRRNAERPHPRPAPDPSVSWARSTLAIAGLVVLLPYLLVAPWLGEGRAMFLYVGLYLPLVGLATVGSRQRVARLRRARAEAEQLRDAALSAGAAGPGDVGEATIGERPRASDGDEPAIGAAPQFDPLGHLVFPVAMACGALVDLNTRGYALPSVLALAFAASQLRIALRDRPWRSHYLFGAMAGSVSAVHFAFVSVDGTLVWMVWFLTLSSMAMLVAGRRDARLSTRPLGTERSAHHVDAL